MKIMVLAKSALQYFAFIHKTDTPASEFVWVREPRMAEGQPTGSRIIVLPQWDAHENPAKIALFTMIMQARGLQVSTEAEFLEGVQL